MSDHDRERLRMEQYIETFSVRFSPKLLEFIYSAYDDRLGIDWDWRNSDGCTGVSEFTWPSVYFPPCVAHDYWCERANRGTTRREYDLFRKYADTMLYHANVAFALPWFRLPFFGFQNSSVGRYFGTNFFRLFKRLKFPKVEYNTCNCP